MAITITAASWAANKATFTTAAPHGIKVGGQVTISGVSPAGYNGTFTAVAGTTGSTIVVAMATNPGTYVSGGKAVNPNAPMTTMGVAIDRNGDIWMYEGSKGLVWLANTTVVVNPAQMEPVDVSQEEGRVQEFPPGALSGNFAES